MRRGNGAYFNYFDERTSIVIPKSTVIFFSLMLYPSFLGRYYRWSPTSCHPSTWGYPAFSSLQKIVIIIGFAGYYNKMQQSLPAKINMLREYIRFEVKNCSSFPYHEVIFFNTL